jgi:hypothetical protein
MYIKATAKKPSGLGRDIILDTAHPDEVIPFELGSGTANMALHTLRGGATWPAGYVVSATPRSEHADIEPEGGRYQRVRVDNIYGNNRPGILDVVTMQYNAWNDTPLGNEKRDEVFESKVGMVLIQPVSLCTDIRPDPLDRYTDTKRIDPKEDNNMATVKQDGVDYKAKYEKLIEDLYAEAKRRNWCSEFDTFAAEVGIEKPKPKYEPEPRGEAVVKFDGMVPASGTNDALGTKRWSFLSTPGKSYTWEEANERARKNHSGTFEILWSL